MIIPVPEHPREAVEVFHLLFLRVLMAGAEKAHYAVKGGCNLRFFFGSVRYSEDLDLDVETFAPRTLRNKVDRILGSGPLPALLRARGLAVESFSSPKQTETTQRWKVQLGIAAGSTVSTKIEFSRRGLAADRTFEAVDAELLRRHRLQPVLAVHYRAPEAIRQKVRALAGRAVTQARDVFDLSLLFARCPPEDVAGLPAEEVRRATENLTSVGYDEFVGQVLAYLEPEHQDLYRDPALWDALQASVLESVERLPR